MKRCIALAKRGWGRTSPNPMVGAVVVDRRGIVVGEGFHPAAGAAHAEVFALRQAGAAARGGTLFVSLEPCSTHGRTPPCTNAVIAAGVRRVVIGTCDPNPAHAGAAIALLKDAGIEVRHGLCQEQCEELNDAFFCWIRHRRPLVQLKLAMTLDGRIATRSGQSQWITGPQARREVQRLRQWADSVMVGGETVRRDDPQLLVREPADWPRQPLRLIATASGDLGEAPQLLHDGLAETRCLHCSDAAAWKQQLAQLGDEGITALLVEGGGTLAASLLSAGCVDKLAFFYAPKVLGGAHSRPAVGGADPASLQEAISLTSYTTRRIGADLLLTGYLTDVHRYS